MDATRTHFARTAPSNSNRPVSRMCTRRAKRARAPGLCFQRRDVFIQGAGGYKSSDCAAAAAALDYSNTFSPGSLE